jgi:hypothetical protein
VILHEQELVLCRRAGLCSCTSDYGLPHMGRGDRDVGAGPRACKFSPHARGWTGSANPTLA